ncbi:MAG: hypothetical protein ACREIE_07910 [Nitrospiraceae bacterium]
MEKEQGGTGGDWRCPMAWRGRDQWPRGEKDDGSIHNGKIRGTNHWHGVWAAGRKAISTMFVVLGLSLRRCCVFEILMAGRRQDADMAQENQRQE